jgi:uncharacterized protein (TIGR00255 family)
MTGFGKADAANRSGKYVVEVSSVNNRFLEVSVRMPRYLSTLESKIRDMISLLVSRGKVNVYINVEESDLSPGKYQINRVALKAYHRQLEDIQKELGLDGKIELKDMMMLPDLANPEKEAVDEDEVWKTMEGAVSKALKRMLVMRRKEGLAMKKDMQQRLLTLSEQLKTVRSLTKNAVSVRRDKLVKRVNELLESPMRDSLRIEEEIAIFADKADITEECTRLASHLKQYRANLSLAEPTGKKLNFILQEMNRETNTIASKASDYQISSEVISMKNEIEKMRELVQNAE